MSRNPGGIATKEDQLDWVRTNRVKRALREGRPTDGWWLHLTLCSDTTLLVQGVRQVLGKFQEEVRP